MPIIKEQLKNQYLIDGPYCKHKTLYKTSFLFNYVAKGKAKSRVTIALKK